MNTLLEFAIVGAWAGVSIMALTRVFSERRRWEREGCWSRKEVC